MIKAPYNFVPLSSAVYCPDDTDKIAHDTPYNDGLSGVLNITLTNDTPLLVSGERTLREGDAPASAPFFKLPDGTFAIPGSSMRGMVRNVLEIASFARMRLVDNKRYGLRDRRRVVYKHTIHDTIKHTGPAHLSDDGRLDLVEAIFGRVGKTPETTLKGRVSFGLMRRQGTTVTPPAVEKILSAPKPSYFPSYVRQTDFANGSKTQLAANVQHKSYMDDNAEIRGWKRYPVRRIQQVDQIPDNANATQVTRLHPLPVGQTFTGKIRFHNLRPAELGALVWALTFGEHGSAHAPTYRHSLGMGRPFGFGVVKVVIDEANSIISENNNSPPKPTLQSCIKEFVATMRTFATGPDGKDAGLAKGWDSSPQIKALLAMANPENAFSSSAAQLQHMTLNPDERINDFVAAKGGKKINGSERTPALVLPEYANAIEPKRNNHPGTFKR